MLNVLNDKLRKLFSNEEGFAIAMTIIVWPLMLLTVSGLFVTGETVRQKIALQNAADAAAHAGAQIQADTLSRIAVINRMMAWTYIQANKMEMDYTVLNWALLANKVMEDLKTPLAVSAAAISPTCQHSDHKKERGEGIVNIQWGWFAGNGGTLSDISYTPNQMLLNNHEALQTKIASLGSLKGSLEQGLEAAFANISSMNSAIDDLESQYANRFNTALQRVFDANTKEFKGSVRFWVRNNPISNFLVPMKDESAFLSLAGNEQKSSLTSTGGISWWQPDGSSGDGFRRAYTGQGLEAQFRIGLRGWQNSVLISSLCVPYLSKYATIYVQGTGAVRSDGINAAGLQGSIDNALTGDAINAKSMDFLGYNKNVRAVPRQLTDEFISKGAVLVAAARPVTNPLAALFGDLTGSWFDAHTLTENSDYWCMSAARACPRDLTKSSLMYSRKNFANYSPGNAEYSAVMLPAAMAGTSAGEVAKEVYDQIRPRGWETLADWSMLNNFASRGE